MKFLFARALATLLLFFASCCPALGNQVIPAQLIRTDSSSVMNPFTAYMGRVRTLQLGARLSELGPIAYDADDDVAVFVVNAGPRYGIYKVTASGSATLLAPVADLAWGIVYDPADRTIYFTSPDKHAIYAVSPSSGQVTLLAGGSYGTMDGQGKHAQFQAPGGIGVDSVNGNLYVTDNDRMRTVTTSGMVTTLTAPGSIGNGSFFCAQFPDGVAYDARRRILDVSDSCLNLIHAVDPSTGAVSTLTGACITFGNPACAPLQRDGSLASALFAEPSGIQYDTRTGDLFVADAANNQIRDIASSGTVSTLAGSGHQEFVDGLGITAGFNNPYGIALRRSNLLFVADYTNLALRTVTAAGAPPPPPPHGVLLYDPPTAASGPSGIVAAPDDSIWFTEGAVSQVGHRLADGSFKEFSLPSGTSPTAIVIGGDGNLWFECYSNQQGVERRAIGTMTAGGAVTIFPLPQFLWYDSSPEWSIATGPDGNVWFADYHAAVIGYVTPSGQYTWFSAAAASSISQGFAGDLWTNGSIVQGGFGMADYTTAGQLIKQYSGPGGWYVARGPNDHMWWVLQDFVGELRGNRSIEYALPKPNCCTEWDPAALIAGADGAIWMPMYVAGYLGRLTTSGAFQAWEVPAPRSDPAAITVAPDGTVWIADPGANKIGRYY